MAIIFLVGFFVLCRLVGGWSWLTATRGRHRLAFATPRWSRGRGFVAAARFLFMVHVNVVRTETQLFLISL